MIAPMSNNQTGLTEKVGCLQDRRTYRAAKAVSTYIATNEGVRIWLRHPRFVAQPATLRSAVGGFTRLAGKVIVSVVPFWTALSMFHVPPIVR